MPIRVVHSPDASIAGQVAHQAGTGQFRQRQDQYDFSRDQFAQQQALQEQRLSEQQYQFDEQLQFRAEQANVQNQFRQQQFNYQADQANFNAGQREQLQARQIQAQFGMEQLRQVGRFEGQEHQAELMAARDQMQGRIREGLNEQNWQAGSAEQLDKASNQKLKEFRKLNLDEGGVKELDGFAARVTALQKQRGSLRPAVYSKEMAKVLTEMDHSGLENDVIKEPTLQELFGIDLGKNEDGTFKNPEHAKLDGGHDYQELPSGQFLLRQPDGKYTLDSKVIDNDFKQRDLDHKIESLKWTKLQEEKKEQQALIQKGIDEQKAEVEQQKKDDAEVAKKQAEAIKKQDELFKEAGENFFQNWKNTPDGAEYDGKSTVRMRKIEGAKDDAGKNKWAPDPPSYEELVNQVRQDKKRRLDFNELMNAPKISSPEDAKLLPPGTLFRRPDGSVMRTSKNENGQ